MKRSEPPALATWLLEHARFSTTDGVIAGELLEEFHTGRSAGWYWRQVLAAIVVGWAREARQHRVLAIRAILITWAANYGAILLGRTVLYEFFGNRHLPGLTIQLALWAICFLGAATSGLIVALLHRRYRNAMLLTKRWRFARLGTDSDNAPQEGRSPTFPYADRGSHHRLLPGRIDWIYDRPVPSHSRSTTRHADGRAPFSRALSRSSRVKPATRVTLGKPKRVTFSKRRSLKVPEQLDAK